MKSKIVFCTTIIMLLSHAGCTTVAGEDTATEDTAYLTPIPRETLQAYQFDTPVRSRMDAVIVARLSLDTTRLAYTQEPKVLLAEETSFEDVRRRVAQPGFLNVINAEDTPGDTEVWLVLFEGDWQITGPPPEEPITPEPPTHGCVYVILLDPNDLMRTQFGTTQCSKRLKL